MLINIQDDIIRLHSAGLLSRLLADKTTGRNIMWATDAYAEHGAKYERNEQIMPELITGTNTGIIKTRARKAFEQQTERTRRRAEVFTPLWVCRKMTDYYYNDCADISEPRRYIDSRQLEITCGEAPFLVSRYDTTTGEPIPIAERIGLLDRKLQLVGNTAENEAEWLKLVKRAYESTYGYEFQGDNLLIARVNLIETFAEYMQDLWNREPTAAEMRPIINIITWNVWQMDGLNGRIPYKTADEDNVQLSFFEEETTAPTQPPCIIYDWRARRPLEYNSVKKGNKTMKFDFVIGNPPYQDEVQNKGDRPNPIYDKFMDASYDIGTTVCLIHPARFLFNAGQTAKQWNKKMLSDKYFKILYYEPVAVNVFPNTDIKGGVAISYRNSEQECGAIEIFTAYNELNSIIKKVTSKSNENERLNTIIASQGLYRFSDMFFTENPTAVEKMGAGTGNKIVSSVMEKLPEVFLDEPTGDHKYVRFLGRLKNQRVYKYIRRDYLIENPYIDTYNLLLPEANNSGAFGETLTEPTIGLPDDGSADTFLSAGTFAKEEEPHNMAKYVKCKFFRALLGVKKVTQHCPPTVWSMIPLQDFTSNSDIDWSKSIPEIDKQLYAKYGLSDDEITFIETHVKEMS